MTDDEIAALAKGVAPFVREIVSKSIEPLAARLTECEACQYCSIPGPAGEAGPKGDKGEKGDGYDAMVGPELAAELAAVVRLLHESPAIAEPKEAPPAAPRLARVKRDDEGNFVPVYE